MQRRIRRVASHKFIGDLDTALTSYIKIANTKNSFIFESLQGGELWGRYSFIGLPSSEFITVTCGVLNHQAGTQTVYAGKHNDPFAYIEKFIDSWVIETDEALPKFAGGLVGYIGYDCIGYIEKKLLSQLQKPDTVGVPDIFLLVCEELLVIDNISHTHQFIKLYNPELIDHSQAAATLHGYEAQMVKSSVCYTDFATLQYSNASISPEDVHATSDFSEHDYKAAVEIIKKHIQAGDVMQGLPSQRMAIPWRTNPIQLYRALRFINPSPYMYYINFGDFSVVGATPEVLVRCQDNQVVIRPIAGTRPRGATPAADIAMEQELLADPKELAEHTMLIDLARNDVGKVAKIGSVLVTDTMFIERYSHVMHIVSSVSGRLRADTSTIAVLQAAFPAGTLSGTPKVRAMEIINEIEPYKRGIYGGCVGFLGWNQSLEMAIAIRTAIIKDGMLYIQAGGGIVADSDAENEWQETLNKRKAMFQAVKMCNF